MRLHIYSSKQRGLFCARSFIFYVLEELLNAIQPRMMYIRMDTVVHFYLKKTRRYVMLNVWRHRAIQVRVETVVFSKHKTSLFCRRLLLTILYLASITAFWGRLCHPYPNVFVLGVRLLAVFSNINKLTITS